jgi:hypothetical protein
MENTKSKIVFGTDMLYQISQALTAGFLFVHYTKCIKLMHNGEAMFISTYGSSPKLVNGCQLNMIHLCINSILVQINEH